MSRELSDNQAWADIQSLGIAEQPDNFGLPQAASEIRFYPEYSRDTIKFVRPNSSLRWLARVAAVGFLVSGGFIVSHDFKHDAALPVAGRTIDLSKDQLPASLPSAVAANIPDSGFIQFQESSSKSWAASGVQLGHDEFLTAGHLFNNENGTMPVSVETCANTSVFTTGMSKRISSIEARDVYSSYHDDDRTATPDLALIRTTKEPSSSQVDIASRGPEIGQDVFFINYEPVDELIPRDPDLGNPRLRAPAIFGGIMLGKDKNGRYDILTNIKSYGEIPQSDAVPGASGGPVYNAGGQLIGTSIELVTDRFDSFGIGFLTGTQPTGSTEQDFQITIVQPISIGTLAVAYSRQQHQTAACH